MSELHPDPALTRCQHQNGGGRQRIATRDAELGAGLHLRRALPRKARRMIGAWCFLDHFGPLSVAPGGGMHVGPHPHIGLQTFSWLLAGELQHRDSLGYEQTIRPGQINLMTAGHGISHAEHSPPGYQGPLHGVQLWIALPASQRDGPPAFQHIADPAVIHDGGWRQTLLAGNYRGLQSPALVHSPLLGLELRSIAAADTSIPLRSDFEHGLLVLDGQAKIDGEALAPGTLLALDCGLESLQLSATEAATVLLIGGAPFEEEILMWWNFVAREPEEMVRATDDWNGNRHFGTVADELSARIPAPITPWHR